MANSDEILSLLSKICSDFGLGLAGVQKRNLDLANQLAQEARNRGLPDNLDWRANYIGNEVTVWALPPNFADSPPETPQEKARRLSKEDVARKRKQMRGGKVGRF